MTENHDEKEGIDVELFDSIIGEMDRIWGEPGFEGDAEQYEWLEMNYGITEEDDVHWQFALQYFITHDLPEEDESDPLVMEFLDDYDAVEEFLIELQSKYRSSDKSYPRA